MSEPHLILGIGELLWDVLPNGMRLGGAPANFAVMAGRLGNRAAILSRIGRDELGRQAIDRLDPMPVETSFLEVDAAHETGRVTVSFVDGEPHYTIHQPAAWDFLKLSDEWVRLVERADALCFGSLAQRNLESRQTIQTLAAQSSASCIRIFDVNLRAPFYSAEVLEESLELATVREDERSRDAARAGIAGSDHRGIRKRWTTPELGTTAPGRRASSSRCFPPCNWWRSLEAAAAACSSTATSGMSTPDFLSNWPTESALATHLQRPSPTTCCAAPIWPR